MLKVHVVYLLYRLSSCGVCLDTISQPSHLPRVHCHKGMVCQRGGGGGEHIYIYIYVSLIMGNAGFISSAVVVSCF